ncbi:SNPC4 protein, partial [Climacteris rufus]|nr:SNPC4 protein [Climacteris rufus]
AGPRRSPAGLDLDAEREKIRREIEELERSLEPGRAEVQLALSDSCLSSGTGSGGLGALPRQPHYFSFFLKCFIGFKEVEIEDSSDDDDDDDDIESLPQDPETCLQMNHVYQEVIKEKIEEVDLLLAQNKEQQKEIMAELDGSKTAKAGDGRNLPANVFLGHFMKPYFKDKTTGIGPPANEDAKEKAAQGIKSFEQLRSVKWKTREKTLLQKSVVSDRLQRLLQPKLLKMSYWNQKLEKVKTEMEKQILEKQIKDLEQEIEAINQLPESELLGSRFDEHDWDKISNIHFDGRRSSEELRKFWQNWEHPSINKKEWTEEEIERLEQIAAKHNYVDWQSIAQELGTSRTPFQCLQKYQIYNKDLKRKEWTKSEDQMLLELVQEMRVGSHIPYKKIAYYMEGRDSAQLIYRWTKSVDPNLKKGPWTPEEDAMLVAAVEKYGERDWYKIRTEVPGRSDAQCRDRYLKALHWDVKKGRWSLEEEEQLIELVQKHGLGHWSKIASELPHRTDSQCLSKWKLMIGSKVLWKSCYKKRRGAPKRRHAEESSSSSESSSEEDMELDLADSSEEEEVTSRTSKEEFTIPSMDLWVPTWTSTQETTKWRYQIQSLLSAGSAGAGPSSSDCSRTKRQGKIKGFTSGLISFNKIPSAEGMLKTCTCCAYSVQVIFYELHSLLSFLLCFHLKAAQHGKLVLQVPLENVKAILRNNTSFQRKLVSAPWVLSALVILLAKSLGVGAAAGQDLQGVQDRAERTLRSWKRLSLDRKLLMAVTPWVGNVLLPCTLQPGRMAFHQTKAGAIREKVKAVSVSSTPLFTLLIQLFQIDTNGCMKMIQERKLRQLELLKANARSSQQVLGRVCNSSQPCSQRNSQRGIPRNAVRRPVALRAGEASSGALESCGPAQGQRQKPKTVLELLREKRLREAQAKKALQRTVLVASQVLVSGPLIIQHPPQQIIPSAQAGSKAAAAGAANNQVQGAAAPVPARTSAAGSASAVVPGNHSSAVPEAGESPGCSQGTDLQSSKELKEQSGTSKLSLSTPVTCELNSSGPQQSPLNLLPALVAPQAGSPVIPNSILPFTWVVAPQALLPSAVQAVVGVPQGMPAAAGRSQGQTTGTANGSVSGLGVTPVPAAANPPQASSAETKGPSSQLAGVPLGKAADHSTVLLPVSSESPTCTTPSVCPVTPARSDGSSLASDSSAAPAAPPADSPALGASGLPQTQPPASTQGSDSQPVVPGNSDCSDAQALKNRPIASKPPSADLPPQPSTSSAEKNLLDFSLISLEDEGLVKEWLSGKQGVQVPSLQTRLPYLPPFLCNIKTLSKLLVQKAALEEQAASLLPSDASGDGGTGDVSRAIGELVQQKLGDNPAYLLLKARFLAAFTLPAVLATLPPPKVTTTLSGSRMQCEESDDEEWLSENEVLE